MMLLSWPLLLFEDMMVELGRHGLCGIISGSDLGEPLVCKMAISG